MRYVIAAILALVTYSASAGKGILQHAPYETVGPMLGKIEIRKPPLSIMWGYGTICHDRAIEAINISGIEKCRSPGSAVPDKKCEYKHDQTIANDWFNRASVYDYEVEIRYVQYVHTNQVGKYPACYYYQAGSSSGKAGEWNWRYPQ